MNTLTVACLLSFITLISSCSPAAKPTITQQVKTQLLAQFDSLQFITQNRFLRYCRQGSSADSIRQAFLQTRRAYKKLEWFTEYYAPTASKELNGAPLPEIEIEETRVFAPSGLQVIEENVFDSITPENRPTLIREVLTFLASLKRTRAYLEQTNFTEAHILDACKQEMYRVMVLGLTGFDTPLAQTGIAEAATTLQSIKQVLSLFGPNEKLETLCNQGIGYLNQHPDFNSFNRMAFITGFVNPITTEITNWQRKLKIEPLKNALALNPTAPTLFAEHAINPDYFAGSPEARITPEKVKLGKLLFFNPVVSGSTRSCASCHRPELAFTDGLPKSAAITAGKSVQRNAPTLLYAGLQTAQFYDMRSPSLENQAMDVLANQDEMHASAEEVADWLNKSTEYNQKFKTAFPDLKTEIQPRHVLTALASYIRSLTPFNSRFDKYMRGDQSQLSPIEITGFNLFMGKAKCGTCHFMPVFNGTAPPSFSNTEAEVLGVPQNATSTNPVIDSDPGRYTHNKIEELKFAFKTPGLRNISLTAPYMHNGAFKTLDEVIDFYDSGGGIGLGLGVPTQTLPSDKLKLSYSEKKALQAFLLTLSDSVYIKR